MEYIETEVWGFLTATPHPYGESVNSGPNSRGEHREDGETGKRISRGDAEARRKTSDAYRKKPNKIQNFSGISVFRGEEGQFYSVRSSVLSPRLRASA